MKLRLHHFFEFLVLQELLIFLMSILNDLLRSIHFCNFKHTYFGLQILIVIELSLHDFFTPGCKLHILHEFKLPTLLDIVNSQINFSFGVKNLSCAGNTFKGSHGIFLFVEFLFLLKFFKEVLVLFYTFNQFLVFLKRNKRKKIELTSSWPFRVWCILTLFS